MKQKLTYIRTSTEEQTPELQLRDIGMTDNIILTEQRSAWKENVKRPVFDDIMIRIKKGLVSDLYVWDLDRIYRNRKRLQEFFILCKENNVKVHSYNQNWLNDINSIQSPFNEIVFDLLINIMGWIGQEESEKKSKRVKMAVVEREGRRYSYKGNKWGRKGMDEGVISRAKVMRGEGKSMREISKLLKIGLGTVNNIVKSI